MSEDLFLNLKDGIKLHDLEIVPEFNGYSELIQKTIVLCLLNESLNLTTNDTYLMDLVQVANTGSIAGFIQHLVPVADRIKYILNADKEDAIIESITFSIEPLSDRSFKLYINIIKTDENTEEGVITING